MWRKRILGLVVALALMVSGFGAWSVRAAQESPTTALLAQEEGGAWLGVRVRDGARGVVITAVLPNSPADEAGLRRGDVIVSVDETPIESAEQLADVISGYAPHDVVTVVVRWRGEERSYEVELGERPPHVGVEGAPTEAWPQHPNIRGVLNMLGVEMRLTDEGLVVASIDPSSPLAEAGFQEGDVVTAINGQEVGSVASGRLLLQLLHEDTLVFTVQREGEELELSVENPMAAFGPTMPEEAAPWGQGPLSPMARPTQLGVSYRMLNAQIAAEEGLPTEQGAQITEVFEGTPAAEADLQVGDIITAVDGDAVDEEHTLRDRLYAYEEGDVVTLSVLREGESLEVQVTLGPKATDGHFGGMMGQGQPFFFGPGFFYFMPWGGEHGPQGDWQGMPWPFFGGQGEMPHHQWELSPAPQAPEQTPSVPSAEA